SKYTAAMRARAKELGMTTSEIITLASIIEREATSTDKELVSSVFHNRLRSGRYQYLQSCATVQYALGERKARLSIEDTKVTSPYNTYQNKGLPPGPIASPGNESIEAALYPAESDYMFFALLKDGTHKFSKTYDEHMKSENVNPN
ncbi:MAG: endolytic transglycosylase MltG, partial [Clostridia bacterium]